MTLPVRIEAKAWTDSRYATLALHLGLSAGDSEIALIRCAAIWRWQTEHYTDAEPTCSVHASVVIGALKSLRGAEALVAAEARARVGELRGYGNAIVPQVAAEWIGAVMDTIGIRRTA